MNPEIDRNALWLLAFLVAATSRETLSLTKNRKVGLQKVNCWSWGGVGDAKRGGLREIHIKKSRNTNVHTKVVGGGEGRGRGGVVLEQS